MNSYERTLSLIFYKGKTRKFVYGIVQFFVTVFNYCSLIINGINFARFLFIIFGKGVSSEIFGSFLFYKIITIILMIVLMILIRTARDLMIPSLISTIVIILSFVVFWFKNTFQHGLKNIENVQPFNFMASLPLIASQVYSVECVGTLLTIRRAMKSPWEMKIVIKYVFSFTLLLFLLNGWSFYLSYKKPIEMSFFYFNNSTWFITVLKFAFYLTNQATMAITVYAMFTLLDSFKFFKGKFGIECEPEKEGLLQYKNNFIASPHFIVPKEKGYHIVY